MDKEYYLERFLAVKHHEERKYSEDPQDTIPTYDTSEYRWRIRSTKTGEIIDDAQGYGYKTAKKAHSAYAYKHRDKSKDKAREKKRKHIQGWMREHKGFLGLMDQIAFEIAKGSWGPDDKFDAKLVENMLKENNLEIDFTAGELLREWRKR